MIVLNKNSVIKNQDGGIIIAMILALGVTYTTVSFFLYAEATSKIQKMLTLSNSSSIEFVKNSVSALIFDSYALTKTIYESANSELKRCMEDSTYDCPRGAHPLTVYDLKQDVYSSPNSNKGFRLQWSAADGFECSSYTASGNSDCPFKYFFYWTPDCPPSGTCRSPSISIKGELKYNPSTNSTNKMNINLNKYELIFSLN